MAVIGWLLIFGGIVGLLLVLFGAVGADRDLNLMQDIGLPCLWCALPILTGAALIWFPR